MNILDQWIEACFVRKEKGDILFYPRGWLGKGYVASGNKAQELHAFVKRRYQMFFIAVLIFILITCISLLPAIENLFVLSREGNRVFYSPVYFFFLFFPSIIFLLFIFFWNRSYTAIRNKLVADLPTVGRLTFTEYCQNWARIWSLAALWIWEAIMILGSGYSLLHYRHGQFVDMIPIAILGLGITINSYALWIKLKTRTNA